MKNRDVIFLIDSDSYDRDMLSLTLEKYTKCKVFNFFSMEETKLYKKLNPKVIVHGQGDINKELFGDHVSYYDVSKSAIKDIYHNSTERVLTMANQLATIMKGN